MDFWDFIFTFIWGLIVGMLSYLFGEFDGFLQVLITLSAVDYLSGLCVGYERKNLSSATGFKGIARKVMIFALVGIANLIDKELLNDAHTLKTAVCLFYIGNEGMSIIENADKLGIPLPNALIKRFKQYKEEHEHSEIKELKK